MNPELEAAIERGRNHKMTPQEVFEQRVSFASEGRDRDKVRRQLIESQGYPAEASERAAIVAWLTEQADKRLQIADADGALELNLAADAIERGEHLKEKRG